MRVSIVLFIIFFQNFIFAQNDCSDAIIICGNTGFSGLTAEGYGAIEEITGVNSCGYGENNSVWLKLSINTSGTLGFIITPESTDIEEDFDFYIFGPTSSCLTLGNSIRCSTTNPSNAELLDNLTGMNEFETETAEGPGANGNSYVNWLTVAAGDSYYMVVDRPVGYSNFSIQWTGTATFNLPPYVATPTNTVIDLFECDSIDGTVDGFTNFNLAQNTSIIRGPQTNITVSYHESQNDATLGLNPISTPSSYINIQNPQTIYARITKNVSGCFETTSFEIKSNSIQLSTDQIFKCDDASDGNDSNGKTTFTVSEISAKIFENQNVSNYTIKYFPTQLEANNNQNEIIQNFYNTISNQQSIFVKIYFTTSCFATLEVKLNVRLVPISSNQTITICKTSTNNGQSGIFKPTDADTLFLNNNPAYSIAYYLNTSDLQNNIVLPNLFTTTTNSQNIIAKITDNLTNCFKTYLLTLKINVTPPRIIAPLEICDSDAITNGITNFNLSNANLNLLPGETFEFYNNENDAVDQTNKIANTSNYLMTSSFNSSVFVRIDNGFTCSSISEIKLIVNKKPVIDSELITDLFVCNRGNNLSVVLKADTLEGVPTDYQYKWFKENINLNLATSQIQINESATYFVEITNSKLCTITKKFIVSGSETAIFKDAVIDDFNGSANTILINYDGNGNYEFSLDGVNFQDSPYFTNVPSGEYTIVINDKKDCGKIEASIYVLSYPTFFTPNGDGYNDIWKIKNIATRPNSSFQIFDRYGKLLGNFDTDTGWNGKFNEQQLPADDYWFVLSLENQKQIKGHFSLKR